MAIASLAERVIWVVGAGSGVGEACAQTFAAMGVRLALTGRRLDALERVAAGLDLPAERLLLLPGDMAAETAVTGAALAVMKRFGAVDALVNCAGANIVARDLCRLSPASVREVLDGNLQSAFLLTIAVLPMMRAKTSGTIVHVSSWSAHHYSPRSGAAYTAAKQGVVALCHAINMEESANGIRACAICPSEINTEFLELRPEPPKLHERQAMLQPADLADIVLFVLQRRCGVCINELVVTGMALQ
jgi:NADP-dependent 3-hydroxy acid dehydrogenase YdfG